MTLLCVAFIATGAVALASQAEGGGSDQVGICHATGSEAHPYVYLAVDREGYENGHYEQHEGDLDDVASEDECPSPTAAALAADEEGLPACMTDAPTPPAAPQPVEESDSAQEAAEPAAAEPAAGEPAAPAPAAPEDPVTETCPADVALLQTAQAHDKRAWFNLTVTNLGPEEANAVQLTDELPDVGRNWHLYGADASACTLTGRDLACDFGDLLAGATRSVSTVALRCPHDCGADLENTAGVTSANDGNASNNEATGLIDVPDCPDAAPAPSTEPAPPASNNSSEPANETQPPASGNQSASGPDANASEPAPPRSDAWVRQTAVQDDERVDLTFVVGNHGPDNATHVALEETLPDVHRAWFLGGADAADCILDGRVLHCGFGELAPGESRMVTVGAFTDKMPCGEHQTSTAVASASEDARPDNDRSSAGILARRC